MTRLAEAIEAVEAFLETGGTVLSAIFVVTFLLWLLIIERLLFLRRSYPEQEQQLLRGWQERPDHLDRRDLQFWLAQQLERELGVHANAGHHQLTASRCTGEEEMAWLGEGKSDGQISRERHRIEITMIIVQPTGPIHRQNQRRGKRLWRVRERSQSARGDLFGSTHLQPAPNPLQ